MEKNLNKMKWCSVGRHSVPKLFHSEKPDRPSCCQYCYTSPPIKKSTKINPKSEHLKNSIRVQPKKEESKETIQALLKALELVFNRHIRNKAKGDNGFFTCTCCGDQYPNDEMDAGHMFAKTYSGTRFHEDNVWPQSKKCNQLEYGNVDQFKERVRQMIGSKRFDALEELKNAYIKWDKEWLLEKIKQYKQ